MEQKVYVKEARFPQKEEKGNQKKEKRVVED